MSIIKIFFHPDKKAFFVALAFGAFGLFGWFFIVSDTLTSAPLAFYYLLLIINTYYSVRLFASITPVEKMSQHAADVTLTVCMFFMAFNLDSVLWFFFWTTLLFLLASVKYALLLGTIPHPRLLRRKILVDLSGATASAIALLVALLGYPAESAWIYTCLYLLANVYLMIVNPLYNLIDNLDQNYKIN